jgi:hypothetical protein
LGEEQANLLKSAPMARPRQPDPALTREELANLRRRLAMLSIDGLERQYREAYERRVLQPNRVPSSMRMQENGLEAVKEMAALE